MIKLKEKTNQDLFLHYSLFFLITKMVMKSKISDVCVPDITLFQCLFNEDTKSVDANKPCFIDAEDDSQIITFADLQSLIRRFATGLRYCFPNLALGDVVALYSPNEVCSLRKKVPKISILISLLVILPSRCSWHSLCR